MPLITSGPRDKSTMIQCAKSAVSYAFSECFTKLPTRCLKCVDRGRDAALPELQGQLIHDALRYWVRVGANHAHLLRYVVAPAAIKNTQRRNTGVWRDRT